MAAQDITNQQMRSVNSDNDCPCILDFTRGLEDIDQVPSDQLYNFPEPTANCKYKHLWEEQNTICCCQTHEGCEQTLGLICYCSRCCKKKDCENCARKKNCFAPCLHLKGKCDTAAMQQDTQKPKEELDAVPIDEPDCSDSKKEIFTTVKNAFGGEMYAASPIIGMARPPARPAGPIIHCCNTGCTRPNCGNLLGL